MFAVRTAVKSVRPLKKSVRPRLQSVRPKMFVVRTPSVSVCPAKKSGQVAGAFLNHRGL